MNFMILFLTEKLSKIKTTNTRLFLGAFIGAFYVIALVLCPSIEIYYTFIAKILLSFLIIAVSFWPDKWKSFIKTLAIFYLCSFLLAGAAFAFMYFNSSGGIVKNGIFYIFYNSKWTILVLSIITVAIVLRVIWEIMQFKLIKEKLILPLKIVYESKKIELFALIDTGNSLYDPITNNPVIVVEFPVLKEILPSEISNVFEQSKDNDLIGITKVVSDSKWFSRFRLIPFTSLGKENGILLGFKPDYIEIGNKQKGGEIKDAIVGIYNKSLSKNEKYNALLGPELV